MHEKEIIAIHDILDMICGNKYLKYGIERYLQEKDLRYWSIDDLLSTMTKIRADIKEIDRPEVNIPIMQDLRIHVEKL